MLFRRKELTKLTEDVRKGFADAKHTDIWSKAGEFTFAEKGNVVSLMTSMELAEKKVQTMREKDQFFTEFHAWESVWTECKNALADLINNVNPDYVGIAFVTGGGSLTNQITDWKRKSDEATKDLQNLTLDADKSVQDKAVKSALQLKSLGDIIQECLTSILSASKAQLAAAAQVYSIANPIQRRTIRSLWLNLSRKDKSASQSAQSNKSAQSNTNAGTTNSTVETERASAWISTLRALEMPTLTSLIGALSQVESSMQQSDVGRLPEPSITSVPETPSAVFM